MEDYWLILIKIVVAVVVLSMISAQLYMSYTSSNKSDEDVEDQEDSDQEDIPKKEDVSKPDISEPVISFVKTFKDNPKRFKVTGGESHFIFHRDEGLFIVNFSEFKNVFLIQDLKEGVNYRVGIKNVILRRGFDIHSYDVCKDLSSDKTSSKITCKLENIDWLTSDESSYLIKELYEGIFLKNKDKVNTLLDERRKKNKERRRNKLKKLYCEEK